MFVFYCPRKRDPRQENSWIIIGNIGLNIREKYGFQEILDVNGFHRFRGSDGFLASVIKDRYDIHGIMHVAAIGFFYMLFAESGVRRALKSWTDIHNGRAIGSLKKMGFTQTEEFSESHGRCRENAETFKRCRWNKFLFSRDEFYGRYACFAVDKVVRDGFLCYSYEKRTLWECLLQPRAIAVGGMILVSVYMLTSHYKRGLLVSSCKLVVLRGFFYDVSGALLTILCGYFFL